MYKTLMEGTTGGYRTYLHTAAFVGYLERLELEQNLKKPTEKD